MSEKDYYDDILNYNTIDIKELNKNAFFHYTNIDNLKSIFEKGLQPNIGDNSMGIEKSKKIFFTFGITNSLVLMESWIRWLIAKSLSDFPRKKLDKPLYKLATTLLKLKLFQPLMTSIVKFELKFSPIKIREYKHLKRILDSSVYLSLDLKYNEDYSLDDIDEVKDGNFDKQLLKIMYNGCDVDDKYMEYWNMHTLTDKKIEPSKIHLIKIGDEYSASNILEYMRKNSNIKIKKELPFLYDYFKWTDKQN